VGGALLAIEGARRRAAIHCHTRRNRAAGISK
jgi:hypothetical protein